MSSFNSAVLAKPDLTVVILTYNEAKHIERAIASVAPVAKDILVVDSFSSDDTVSRAHAAGARVLQNPFINQSRQFQWGMDHGEVQTQWVMRLDADEVIEADLAAEIARELPVLPSGVVGVNLNRKHIFMGRWIRHGGRYPLRLLRIWRNGHGRVEDRWMDEHIVVWGGRTVTFKGGFADVNLNDLTFFTEKHNKYATREAIEKLNQRYGLFADKIGEEANVGSQQAAIKRALKNGFYNKLPFGLGPLVYFLLRYFIQLGFLDGRPGLIYHLLQGFWYRFLVEAKTEEFNSAISHCATNDERISCLSKAAGLHLDL